MTVHITAADALTIILHDDELDCIGLMEEPEQNRLVISLARKAFDELGLESEHVELDVFESDGEVILFAKAPSANQRYIYGFDNSADLSQAVRQFAGGEPDASALIRLRGRLYLLLKGKGERFNRAARTLKSFGVSVRATKSAEARLRSRGVPIYAENALARLQRGW